MISRLIYAFPSSLPYLCFGLMVLGSQGAKPIHAQIIPDDTLPNPSTTGSGCTQCIIDGGTVRGQNLFHSFSEFSIPTGGEAIFNNSLQIENILSRVTGNSISDIDGLVQANGDANLFLLNPNGIIFGPNTQLNIGGSFLASTADAIEFDDQRFYRASDPGSSPLLSVNVPVGLQYGTQSPGTITNSGILEVAPSQNLALVGGTVTLDGGQLSALGGQIDLASLASAGTIEIASEGNKWQLVLPEGVGRGNVSLINDARVDVTADNSGNIAIQAQDISLNGERTRLLAGLAPPANSPENMAGDITLNAIGGVFIEQGAAVSNDVLPDAQGNGGAIRITANSVSLINGGQINTTLFGRGSTGQIAIDAQAGVLISGVFFTNFGFPLPSGLNNLVWTDAQGRTGDIDITVRQGSLEILDGASSAAVVLGEGESGDVSLQASDSIIVDGIHSSGFPSAIASSVQAGATGQGGNLTIRTGTLTASNGAEIIVTTSGIGDAGTIDIKASNAVILEGPDTPTLDPFSDGERVGGIFADVRPFVPIQDNLPAKGQGGDIHINTPSLSIADGAIVEASTLGEGDAGEITIQARDLLIRGRSPLGASSGIFSAVQSDGEGLGGDIEVTAESLRVIEAGKISTASFGQGDAGDIRLFVGNSVLLKDENSGLFADVAEDAVGRGGSIIVDAGRITMADSARITVESLGNGRAGRTVINAERLSVRSGAAITSSTFSDFDAGDIRLRVGDRLLLFGDNSGIFARTEPESGGNGGSILIETRQLQALDGASITTESQGSGRSGNIRVIGADSVEILTGAAITSSTFSDRNAGDIRLRVGVGLPVQSAYRLLLSGDNSGIFARTEPGSGGNGGSILVDTGQIQAQDGASITTESLGTGRGGDIQLSANRLTLDNQAQIFAETASNTGGDISLDLDDILLLRRGGRISTSAGLSLSEAEALGDGGNITIDLGEGFIVAVTEENSDITANASAGRGGNIRITTQGIFGIEPRPDLTPLSDITASSEFGIDGVIEINTLDVDPSDNTIELPSSLVDASQLVAEGCLALGQFAQTPQGEFVAIGRGGVVPSPTATLSSSEPLDDLQAPANWNTTETTATQPLREAQRWVQASSGEVTLVAELPLRRFGRGC